MRSEWLKLATVRSLRAALVVIVVATAGLAALLAFTVQPDEFAGTDTSIWSIPAEVISSSLVVTTIVVGVFGAQMMAQDYTGTLVPTLAAVPRRTPVLAAKALVTVIASTATTAVALAIGIAVAAAVLPADQSRDLTHPGYWASVVGAVVFTGLVALLALAIGVVASTGIAGVAGSLGLLFVAPVAMNIFAARIDQNWARNLAACLPTNAGAQLYDVALWERGTPEPDPGLIGFSPLGGGLVLVAWVVAGLAVAAWVLRRRDV